jgi:hypothetical protein
MIKKPLIKYVFNVVFFLAFKKFQQNTETAPILLLLRGENIFLAVHQIWDNSRVDDVLNQRIFL